MRRREFLKTTGALTTGVLLNRSPLQGAVRSPSPQRPNLLVILTDQQFADAMSCAIGRRYIHTPNMDSLAENGVRFTRAYCPNPLCVPSRASMFTGRYPHEVGIQTNAKGKIDPDEFVCMGRIFQTAGYDTGFFGKWHMPFRESKKNEHGFDTYVGSPARYSGLPAAQFIAQTRKQPFLAVASFLNPHNICEWSRDQTLPGGPVGNPPSLEQCPPLKPNMGFPEGETDTIRHMRQAYQAHRLFPVGHFSQQRWRQYLWAYYRLTEKVDRQVGTLLGALRRTGQEENTVVVFLSDHGECHGVHGWNQKTVFYDEASRVPLIISQKGTTPKGTCDSLVNTGVDLIPTLCQFGDIDVPAGLPGVSLRASVLGTLPDKDRPYTVVSNRMVQCKPVGGLLMQPDGRMVRSDRYKYCVYNQGTRRESLVDMRADPGETVNLVERQEMDDVLQRHRTHLREFAQAYGDKVGLSMLEDL